MWALLQGERGTEGCRGKGLCLGHPLVLHPWQVCFYKVLSLVCSYFLKQCSAFCCRNNPNYSGYNYRYMYCSSACKAKHCSYFWFTEEKMRFREFNQTLLFSFLDQILVFSLKLEPLTEPWSAGPTCACCEHITWQELPPILLLLVPGNSAKKLQVI